MAKLATVGHKLITIEDLINECHAKEMRFSNLFELPGGKWRCNLVHRGNWADFGEGLNAVEAIRDAIRRTEKVVGVAVVESAEDLL